MIENLLSVKCGLMIHSEIQQQHNYNLHHKDKDNEEESRRAESREQRVVADPKLGTLKIFRDFPDEYLRLTWNSADNSPHVQKFIKLTIGKFKISRVKNQERVFLVRTEDEMLFIWLPNSVDVVDFEKSLAKLDCVENYHDFGTEKNMLEHEESLERSEATAELKPKFANLFTRSKISALISVIPRERRQELLQRLPDSPLIVKSDKMLIDALASPACHDTVAILDKLFESGQANQLLRQFEFPQQVMDKCEDSADCSEEFAKSLEDYYRNKE
ncbi:MAG: hypothetical protein MHMPM18_002273 [Marteilia pararefringens]